MNTANTYLIDTHVFLWMLSDYKKLSNRVLPIIEDANNILLMIAISFWEIAIKFSIGKLNIPISLAELEKEAQNRNIITLNVTTEHFLSVAKLPFHHSDPFDRVIISQVIIENIPLISADGKFQSYEEIDCIW